VSCHHIEASLAVNDSNLHTNMQDVHAAAYTPGGCCSRWLLIRVQCIVSRQQVAVHCWHACMKAGGRRVGVSRYGHAAMAGLR
jgi:hypothetical protein